MRADEVERIPPAVSRNMPSTVTCACGQKLKAPDNLAGKMVKCPKCKQPLKIPSAASTSEIDLSTSSSLSSGLDDLFSQELGTPGVTPPAGFNTPAQFGRGLPPNPSQNTDGFPKWMLWTGGVITVVLLLGLGIAMVVTSLVAGSKSEPLAQAEVALNEDGKPLAPDEVRNVDVAGVFKEQTREKVEEPAPSAKAIEPTESDELTDEEVATEDSEIAPSALTDDDLLPSESEDYAEETNEEISEEIDEAVLEEIRDRIKNETPGVPPPLNIDPEIETDLRKTFDALMEAYRREVRDLFVPIVDNQRFAETIFNGEYFQGLSADDQERARKLITAEHSFVNALFNNKWALKFDSYEFRNVEVSPNKKTAAVIVRVMNPELHESMKFRFWLCRPSTDWKFFDFEILSSAIRLSKTLIFRSGTREQLQPFMQEIAALTEAGEAYRTSDHDRLGKVLDRLEAMTLTERGQFVVPQLRTLWCFKEKDFERALEQAELAHTVAPHSPELFLLRAIAHNGLENFGTAVLLANTYERRLGRDENYWYSIGVSLMGLAHPEDAVAAWERGLEYNPHSADLLLRLAVAYSMDTDKMVPHIIKDKLPDDAFDRLIAELKEAELTETCDRLIEARQKE